MLILFQFTNTTKNAHMNWRNECNRIVLFEIPLINIEIKIKCQFDSAEPNMKSLVHQIFLKKSMIELKIPAVEIK